MTDRELLELAAKAAGLRVGFEPDGKQRGGYDLYWSCIHSQLVWHNKSTGSEYPEPLFWNPLTDDGDALRLAVKLHLPVEAMIAFVAEREPDWHKDPYAATRRAITRAAAEMGKSV